MNDHSSAGKADSVETAFRQERGMLRRFIARRIRDPQEAEDYVQEVYLRVLAVSSQNKIGNFRGFLLRIASNLIIDLRRRDGARLRDRHVALEEEHHPTDDGAESPERIVQARQQLQRLNGVLAGLDPAAAEVFRLVRLEGRSHHEAAVRLGIDVRSVSRHLERVLVKLAKAIDP